MDHTQLAPCAPVSQWIHLAIALGVALNTALATWLAHRRYRQDRFHRSPERKAFELWRTFVTNGEQGELDARTRNTEEP